MLTDQFIDLYENTVQTDNNDLEKPLNEKQMASFFLLQLYCLLIL